MGIEAVTAHPSRYAAYQAPRGKGGVTALPETGRIAIEGSLRRRSAPRGSLLLSSERRRAAQAIAAATNNRAVYDRQAQRYRIGRWSVDTLFFYSDFYDLADADHFVSALEKLDQAGFVPDDELRLHFMDPRLDRRATLQLIAAFEREDVLQREADTDAGGLRVTVYARELVILLPFVCFDATRLMRVLNVLAEHTAVNIAVDGCQYGIGSLSVG